jgi:hypothetical protein
LQPLARPAIAAAGFFFSPNGERTMCRTSALLALALAGAVHADDKIEARGSKVEFDVHSGHFEKNNSGLKGDVSFLAFTDRAAFDKVFGIGAVMDKKQNFVPKDAFAKKMVVAVIHRGKAVWTYKVDKVTADGDELYVQYEATPEKESDTAKFASPLIVSVDKGKYTSVVFIENGKKAGTVNVGK